MGKDNTKIIDIQITTDLHSLQMLSKKYSKESQVASYVYGMTKAMFKDLENFEKARIKQVATQRNKKLKKNKRINGVRCKRKHLFKNQ